MQKPFRQGAIAEEGDRDGIALEDLMGQSASKRDRQARTDDAVGAQHPDGEIRDVHRTAAPTAEPFIPRQQLCKKAFEGKAFGKCMAMPAMGRGDRVGRAKGAHDTCRHRLLADAEMNESGHLAIGEQLGQPLFTAPDKQDHLVKLEQLLALGERDFAILSALASALLERRHERPPLAALFPFSAAAVPRPRCSLTSLFADIPVMPSPIIMGRAYRTGLATVMGFCMAGGFIHG